jgi:septum formation topological specificity factor MinE
VVREQKLNIGREEKKLSLESRQVPSMRKEVHMMKKYVTIEPLEVMDIGISFKELFEMTLVGFSRRRLITH